MKSIITIGLLLIFGKFSQSQNVFSNQTNVALEKVIQDYPNKFKNIKGALIINNPQATDYASNITIPGSLSCIVTEYSSTKKDVVSWRAELFETEEFDEAKKQYKDVFNQIKNTIVKIDGEKSYILNGQFQNPEEKKRYHSTFFTLIPSNSQLQKIKVELVLQYQLPFWKISLTIYDRDREDNEKGSASER